MIETATVLEEEAANRTLDGEMDRKRKPGNVEKRENLDQHRNAGGSPARVGIGTAGEA